MPDSQHKPAQPAAAPAKAPAQPSKSWYVVTHGAVGPWEQGTVISSDDLANIDVDRLLRLGAITPTQEPIKDVAPAAADDDQ